MEERCNRVDLIEFIDANRDMSEVILYLKDLSVGKMNILSAKNKIIKKNTDRTIPVLELSVVMYV
jgi:hypothetical protein